MQINFDKIPQISSKNPTVRFYSRTKHDKIPPGKMTEARQSNRPPCGRDASPRRPRNFMTVRELQPGSITQPNSYYLQNPGRAAVPRRPDYSNNLPKWLHAPNSCNGQPQQGSITHPRVARNELPWVTQPKTSSTLKALNQFPIKVQINAIKPAHFNHNLSASTLNSECCGYFAAQTPAFRSSLIKANQGSFPNSFVPFVFFVNFILNLFFPGQTKSSPVKPSELVGSTPKTIITFCVYGVCNRFATHIAEFWSNQVKTLSLRSLRCLLLNPSPHDPKR
jgi:hypothetical protein